jgi:type IV pilus assembly protein PilA
MRLHGTIAVGCKRRNAMASKLLERRATMRRTTLEKVIKGRRGFTLVELGVVVTIVGILAVIAIVGYRKMILSSKLSEAKTMINAIRLAEEDYKAESGGYMNISAAYCPSDGSQQKKFAWENTTCASNAWAQLPVHADGPVQFGYAVFAGNTVAQPGGVPATLIDLSPFNGSKVPYYVVHAKADLDPGGNFSQLAGSSFSGHIYTLDEGE